MSRPPLSEAQEDYLKQLFLLEEGEEPVSTQALAERIGVRPASVSGMLRKLTEAGLIEHVPYHGARLTPQGRRIALELLRHHRLLEAYLVHLLGYLWDEVHEEAERLEHTISETFEARIAQLLQEPSYDPHGDPIPGPDLELPSTLGLPLPQLPPGTQARLTRVTAQDRDTLHLLDRLGLVPGSHLKVLEVSGGDVRLLLGAERFLIPRILAQALWALPEEA